MKQEEYKTNEYVWYGSKLVKILHIGRSLLVQDDANKYHISKNNIEKFIGELPNSLKE